MPAERERAEKMVYEIYENVKRGANAIVHDFDMLTTLSGTVDDDAGDTGTAAVTDEDAKNMLKTGTLARA
ncbi:MAG: hypothetical protein WBZ42_02895 [Halobacteriota archaeon]